ncbi:hypothetical protein RND71_015867 [Anisodus tanguticus]|uniref:Uncharacterized protein n=1 Tax=Anisodus tanguticus TaxID=243964 RepID=A0AAE1VKS0_9SOLA|nr:hypothetical protein RND71_015867 [Anisodus tanguticus]
MNNFHGEIPRSLPTGLRYLGLYGNQLGGQVPRSLVNCTSLEALDLGNNKINDTNCCQEAKKAKEETSKTLAIYQNSLSRKRVIKICNIAGKWVMVGQLGGFFNLS